jgi:hypothetical protein
LLAWRGVHESSTFQTLCVQPPPADLPPAAFPWGFQICTDRRCSPERHLPQPASELPSCNAYNNQPAVVQNLNAMGAKFAKNEEKSFNIRLRRCFIYFINGLMINTTQWVVCRGKGRICIDCTNGPNGANTNTSANTYIPGLKENNMLDTCSPAHHASAFLRHLQHLWRTGIMFPVANILQHCDDIDATFRRVLYNSELAIVLSSVFFFSFR